MRKIDFRFLEKNFYFGWIRIFYITLLQTKENEVYKKTLTISTATKRLFWINSSSPLAIHLTTPQRRSFRCKTSTHEPKNFAFR